MSDRKFYAWLIFSMVVATLFLVVLFLSGCSREFVRGLSRDDERDKIRDQGVAFCQRYPDDVACKGPKEGSK